MNQRHTPSIALVIATLLALPAAHAALSKADYKATKTQIASEYKASKSACGALAGNAKDICVEDAKAKEKVSYAELEYNYTGKASDQNKVWVAKAEGAYSIAKEKCDDKSGNAKDVCIKEAKATEAKVLADAKLGKEINASTKEAADTKRDADYKVAYEKCDSLSGDAKSNCISAAKVKFGKS